MQQPRIRCALDEEDAQQPHPIMCPCDTHLNVAFQHEDSEEEHNIFDECGQLQEDCHHISINQFGQAQERFHEDSNSESECDCQCSQSMKKGSNAPQFLSWWRVDAHVHEHKTRNSAPSTSLKQKANFTFIAAAFQLVVSDAHGPL